MISQTWIYSRFANNQSIWKITLTRGFSCEFIIWHRLEEIYERLLLIIYWEFILKILSYDIGLLRKNNYIGHILYNFVFSCSLLYMVLYLTHFTSDRTQLHFCTQNSSQYKALSSNLVTNKSSIVLTCLQNSEASQHYRNRGTRVPNLDRQIFLPRQTHAQELLTSF